MHHKFKDDKDVFNGAKNFREIMVEALESRKMKLTKTDYKNSGWPYHRAYADGYNDGLKAAQEMMKETSNG